MGIMIINLTWHCPSCCVCTLTGGILFCVQVYNWITRSSQSKTAGGEIKECQVACKTWGKRYDTFSTAAWHSSCHLTEPCQLLQIKDIKLSEYEEIIATEVIHADEIHVNFKRAFKTLFNCLYAYLDC